MLISVTCCCSVPGALIVYQRYAGTFTTVGRARSAGIERDRAAWSPGGHRRGADDARKKSRMPAVPAVRSTSRHLHAVVLPMLTVSAEAPVPRLRV
jgi:hypothetical protein